MGRPPTASVRIDVFPSGTPGQVLLQVVSDGPQELSEQEIASLLRSAYEVVTGQRLPPPPPNEPGG
jgi:hypothetical protein